MKRRISILLMVVTIAAIVLFQAYWLRKNYVEENRVLTLRTNLLFRETLFKLQASKLHLDTSFHFKAGEPPVPVGVLSTVNIIRDRFSPDSPVEKGHARSVIVTMRGDQGVKSSDTGVNEVFFQKHGAGGGVAAFLARVDSLQEPVTVKEMQDRFAQVLSKEGIHASFVIKATPMSGRKDRTFIPDGEEGRVILPDKEEGSVIRPDVDEGSVILGFAKPISYQVRLENTFWLMARRLGPQLLFSLVLVGVTILSFLLLYRNWRQQQKLILLKNDFISNITHELKTPIATVTVAVEALKEFDALKDPVRTREYLEISAHELQRLSLLVDKVLKLSLFEKQEIELRKDEFDLKVLVEDVMASMRLQFEKHQAKVKLLSGPNEPGIRVVGPGRGETGPDERGRNDETGPDEQGWKDETGRDGPGLNIAAEGTGGHENTGRVRPAHSDPGRFQLQADKMHFTSVIYNLLDNALKYSKATPRVMINLHGDSDHILLSVTDNGIGIPADYRDRIFEKFFRVPTGDHHNIKGYGLGLSYVAYVVNRHGGEIKVRSKEGFGSIFTIKIPRGYA
ncbi:MAG TPA: HAMP domain-containing sensor histidine kinase [Puia sp.]|nr:HAMP domain-containing sensor histidine kinase [Puia sp.]